MNNIASNIRHSPLPISLPPSEIYSTLKLFNENPTKTSLLLWIQELCNVKRIGRNARHQRLKRKTYDPHYQAVCVLSTHMSQGTTTGIKVWYRLIKFDQSSHSLCWVLCSGHSLSYIVRRSRLPGVSKYCGVVSLATQLVVVLAGC